MPELPEVESQARDLRHLVTGRRIIDVWVGWKKTVATPSVEKFRRGLIGRRFKTIQRRGKFIIIKLAGGTGAPLALISHFRMTGHFRIAKLTDSASGKEWYRYPADRFTRVAFKLAPARAGNPPDILHFSDIRKFGRLWLIPQAKITTLPELRDLGPEPLDPSTTPTVFVQCLRRYRGMIKPILLNQSCLAGVGNIYADESFFDAGLHPTTRVEKITDQELVTLFKMIKLNLANAVQHGGSTVGEFIGMRGKPGRHRPHLRVYGRAGESCKRRRNGKPCGGTVKRIVVAQRGTHICPVCQKVRR